ncbi:hypothetical protein [Thalassobacillus sp. CUG 92003]|uniref:hypothetical protein n=1 Tax=Thalassobacillus sp. CUG 92003 TaxID=2736641 RepID=UPI0015E6ABFB|nr:hypothetical protein [Thalassobacillus sp. CUG 92003]
MNFDKKIEKRVKLFVDRVAGREPIPMSKPLKGRRLDTNEEFETPITKAQKAYVKEKQSKKDET